MPWPQAYDQTQMKVETCLFSTARLENRERIFKWVGPLATNEWGLYAKTGFKDPIAKLADARPYRIGGVTNDAKVLWLRDNALTNIVTVNEDKLVPGMLTLDRKKLDGVDLWVTGIYAQKFITAKSNVKDVKLVLKIREEPLWLACHPSLSEATIKALQDALAAMKLPDIQEKSAAVGAVIVGGTPEQYGEYLKSEIAKFARVVKEAKISAQ